MHNYSAMKIIRFLIAYVFIISGLMKFFNEPLAQHFLSLGLPYPHTMLIFVILLEIGCGLLILCNKKVKMASIPLIAIMICALLLTKLPLLHSGFLTFAFQARLDIVMLGLLVLIYSRYP